MSDHEPGAFFSYTSFDDEACYGCLTQLCKLLGKEVRTQTGEPFPIFLDREDIAWGQNWRKRIDQSLDTATLLIPVITPTFFKRKECRSELSRFLEREQQVGRDDLILPIHFIEVSSLKQGTGDDRLMKIIASRQMVDCFDLRFIDLGSREAREHLAKLGRQVTETLERIGYQPASRNFTAPGRGKLAGTMQTGPASRIADANVHNIFMTVGQPTITYVERDKGIFEQKLGDALDNRGRVCLLTGPSKTGKTTLYKKVVESRGLVPLTVSCHQAMTLSDITSKALNRVQEIMSSRPEEVPMRGTPSRLLPVLRNSRLILVIEDCHYLKPEVQKTLFQQWKEYIDEGISVIVVGTTRHAPSLAAQNRDLRGRISQINHTNWNEADLAQIAIKGFEYLGVTVPGSLLDVIAHESAALPILTQSVCLKLILNQRRKQPGRLIMDLKFRKPDVFKALHDVAIDDSSGDYARTYDRLVHGPGKTRKYKTFEMVLGAFGLDPLTFALTREEIDERLTKWPADLIPPRGAVTGMLNDLQGYQARLGWELLEWSPEDNTLSIVDPTFLFYLRWRQPRKVEPDFLDIIGEVIGERKSPKNT